MTREEAIVKLRNFAYHCYPNEEFLIAIEALEQEPCEDAEKVGRWIEKEGYDGDTYYDCTNCGESWTTIDGTPWNNGMKYCPKCGAKMEDV